MLEPHYSHFRIIRSILRVSEYLRNFIDLLLMNTCISGFANTPRLNRRLDGMIRFELDIYKVLFHLTLLLRFFYKDSVASGLLLQTS